MNKRCFFPREKFHFNENYYDFIIQRIVIGRLRMGFEINQDFYDSQRIFGGKLHYHKLFRLRKHESNSYIDLDKQLIREKYSYNSGVQNFCTSLLV